MSVKPGNALAKAAASLQLGPGVRILKTHECGLIAFFKPAGVLAHPNSKGVDKGALVAAEFEMEHETYRWTDATGDSKVLHLLHRLDSATSGVILAAFDTDVARSLRESFATRKVEKVYHAVVRGNPTGPFGAWRDRVFVNRRNGRVRSRISPGRGGLTCFTVAKKERSVPGKQPVSLLRLEPKTGRTHQLRVQCAERHMPILGDAIYGDFSLNKVVWEILGERRMLLHASEITATFSWRGREISFHANADAPEAFSQLLSGGLSR